MAQDYAASVSGTHIRVSRLNPDGSIKTGANASYVTSAFLSLSMTPEYEDGDEFTSKAADGTVCASYKAADTLKRVSLEIAICNPDPEFTELISGGLLLAETGTPANSLGWAAPEIGKDAMNGGAVAIEAWSRAIIDGKPAATNAFWHWLFPWSVMRPSGDRVLENGLLGVSFSGYSVGNELFGDGPAVPLWPYTSGRAFAYARTASVPSGSGYQAVVAGP